MRCPAHVAGPAGSPDLVDHVIPLVPVRQWVLSLPIPLRVLLAAQPGLVTPVLQMVQRVVTRICWMALDSKAKRATAAPSR